MKFEMTRTEVKDITLDVDLDGDDIKLLVNGNMVAFFTNEDGPALVVDEAAADYEGFMVDVV